MSERIWDCIVIGAGHAGLSAAHHLDELGVDMLVLDGNPAPGGAWQHRWDSLSMDDLHGVANLPGVPPPPRGLARANRVVPAYFAAYERDHDFEVVRPVRVDRVEDEEGVLRLVSGGRTWLARTVINATGTWETPFRPNYPGVDTFTGIQLHGVEYPGAEAFADLRVVVVGGGASAVRFLAELAGIATTVWVTRSEPAWVRFHSALDGMDAAERVEKLVVEGHAPTELLGSIGILRRTGADSEAQRAAFERHEMFTEVRPDGVVMADGSFVEADVILWATGFRADVEHLDPLELTSENGGIRIVGGDAGPFTATQVADDPRVHMIGYGPSASTVGGSRAGAAAAKAVRASLDSASLPLAPLPRHTSGEYALS